MAKLKRGREEKWRATASPDATAKPEARASSGGHRIEKGNRDPHKEQKLKQPTPITINDRAEEFMLKLRDLKDIVFGKLGM